MLNEISMTSLANCSYLESFGVLGKTKSEIYVYNISVSQLS